MTPYGLKPENQMLALGKVVKAQGLRGELKVAVYSGAPEVFSSLNEVLVGGMPFEVRSRRLQGRFVVLALQGIAERWAAEAQVGQEVSVGRSQMPPLAEDEFYWHEVLGLKVLTDRGQELGTVQALIATGGHDVMVVKGQGREYLIPMVRELLVRQDAEQGVLVISPWEGLLEINQPDDAL